MRDESRVTVFQHGARVDAAIDAMEGHAEAIVIAVVEGPEKSSFATVSGGDAAVDVEGA